MVGGGSVGVPSRIRGNCGRAIVRHRRRAKRQLLLLVREIKPIITGESNVTLFATYLVGGLQVTREAS